MPSTRLRLKPRLVPRQARAVETRARILGAAARIFAAHGYAKGTTNRIADAAGLSVGSLYQYFPNKEAILVELARAHLQDGQAVIVERFADPDLPPDLEGRVRVFVDATIAIHAGMPRLHEVLFNETPWPADFLAEVRAFEAQTIAAAEALLATDPSVCVPDLHVAATVAVGTIEGLAHHFIARADELDEERFKEEIVAMVTTYLTGGRG